MQLLHKYFNPVAELVILIGIPTKEADSYSLIHFDLFLQLNNFLFHIYFSVFILDLCFLLT